MNYNLDGLKYFSKICTINKQFPWMELPNDIKIYIWNLCHIKPYIECFVCKSIILNLEIDIRDDIFSDYFIQSNLNSKCISCF